PNAIFSVFPATNVSVSNGSNIYCQSAGNFPSVVPGYGSCGLIGQINLSKTHKESKPAFSAPFARLMIFSFVAWPSPACGNLNPIFTSLNILYSINIITNSMKDYAIKYKLCLSHREEAVSKLVCPYYTLHQLDLQTPVSTTCSYPSPT